MGLLNADEEVDIVTCKELVFFVNGKKVSRNSNDLFTKHVFHVKN